MNPIKRDAPRLKRDPLTELVQNATQGLIASHAQRVGDAIRRAYYLGIRDAHEVLKSEQ